MAKMKMVKEPYSASFMRKEMFLRETSFMKGRTRSRESHWVLKELKESYVFLARWSTLPAMLLRE